MWCLVPIFASLIGSAQNELRMNDLVCPMFRRPIVVLNQAQVRTVAEFEIARERWLIIKSGVHNSRRKSKKDSGSFTALRLTQGSRIQMRASRRCAEVALSPAHSGVSATPHYSISIVIHMSPVSYIRLLSRKRELPSNPEACCSNLERFIFPSLNLVVSRREALIDLLEDERMTRETCDKVPWLGA